MFASVAKRAVESFLDALNTSDADAVSRVCTDDARFNDCMFESVETKGAIAAFVSELGRNGLGLYVAPTSIVRRGSLILVQADMSSNDARFCGPLQLTFLMQGRKIKNIDAHRGADAASIVRLYGRRQAA